MKLNCLSLVLLLIYALTNYKMRTQLAAAEHESRLTYENFLRNSSRCLKAEMDMCIFESDDMCPFWKNLKNTCRVIESRIPNETMGKDLQKQCKAFGEESVADDWSGAKPQSQSVGTKSLKNDQLKINFSTNLGTSSKALMVVFDILREQQLKQCDKFENSSEICEPKDDADAVDEKAATQRAIPRTDKLAKTRSKNPNVNFISCDSIFVFKPERQPFCAESLECLEYAKDYHTARASACQWIEQHYDPCHLGGLSNVSQGRSSFEVAEEHNRQFRIVPGNSSNENPQSCACECVESWAFAKTPAAGCVESNCWIGHMPRSDCWTKGKSMTNDGVALQACCCNSGCTDHDALKMEHVNFHIESEEEYASFTNGNIFQPADGASSQDDSQMNEDVEEVEIEIVSIDDEGEEEAENVPEASTKSNLKRESLNFQRSESVIVAENDSIGLNVTEIFSEELDLYAIVIIAEGMPIPTDLSYVLTAPLAVNNLTSNPMLADVREWVSNNLEQYEDENGQIDDFVSSMMTGNDAEETEIEPTLLPSPIELLRDLNMSATKDHELRIAKKMSDDSKPLDVVQKRAQLVRDLFKRVDLNRDDYVCYDELRQWLHYIEYLQENRLTDQLWQRLVTPTASSLSWPQYSRQIYGYIRPIPHMDGDLWNFNDQHIWRDYRRWHFADENNDQQLNRGEFDKFMHVKIGMSLQELFINETMQLVDVDEDDIITFDEYINEIFAERMREYEAEVNEMRRSTSRRSQFQSQSQQADPHSPIWLAVERENFLLDFDLDRNGGLNRSELFHFLNYSISEYLHKRTQAIIEQADTNNDQQLSFNEMFNNYALFIGTAVDMD